jgi:hypothetical protein
MTSNIRLGACTLTRWAQNNLSVRPHRNRKDRDEIGMNSQSWYDADARSYEARG